jgi:hypothetical protein
MVINRAAFAKALYPGVAEWYGASYNERAAEYLDLFDTFMSKRAYEEFMHMVNLGLAVQKKEGNAVSYDSMQQGYLTRVQALTWALGFIVTEEMIEDSVYMEVAEARAKALGRSMRETPNIVGANVYNRAFNSTYKGGDSKEMCATDHPNISGGTWANELTTAADLSEAALEQACIDIGGFTDDRGIQISAQPLSLHIHRSNIFEAERILMSPLRVGTGDNDLNALRSMSKIPGGFKVNHYFNDADAWFLRTDIKNALKYVERKASQFAQDGDFDTGNLKYKAVARYAFMWTDPRGIFASPGA